MKKAKWGIISTGWISHMFVEGALKAENAEILAVASRNQETAQKFADQYGIPQTYGSYEEMLEKSGIDIAYIGTPNTCHLENVLLCLDADVGVLCEKPLGTNERETRMMVDKAREKNLFFMEAMWTRFFPAMVQAKKWIAEGRIGKPLIVNSSFGINNSDKTQWRWDAKAAGGALMDLGIYGLAFAMDILGAPVGNQSFCELYKGIDCANEIVLKHGENAFSHTSSSFYVKYSNHGTIFGEKGSIFLGRDFWRPTVAKLFLDKGDMFSNELEEVYEAPYEATGYQFEADAVSGYVAEGLKEAPEVPLSDTIAIAHTIDELRKVWGVVFPSDLK